LLGWLGVTVPASSYGAVGPRAPGLPYTGRGWAAWTFCRWC